jgi:hypothetical protein
MVITLKYIQAIKENSIFVSEKKPLLESGITFGNETSKTRIDAQNSIIMMKN